MESFYRMIKRDKESFEYLKQHGISIEDIENIIEEKIEEIVSLIENEIHNADKEQKESVYKKWYPYHWLSADEDPILERVIKQVISDDDRSRLSPEEYTHICNNLIIPAFSTILVKTKESRRVRGRLEATDKPFSRIICFVFHLSGLSGTWIPGDEPSLGRWLFPKEREGSERARWLEESMFETVGRGVPVTHAKAGIDDSGVHKLVEHLNNYKSGKEILENMIDRSNNEKVEYRFLGRYYYIYKKRGVAIVFDR